MSATIGKNEEVLLRVDKIKCRNVSDVGVLYVLPNRILWTGEKNGSSNVSHGYEDIRVQKISPEGKSKVQLQICLNNGDSTTFQFVNDSGMEKQLQDREAVKELLQQLLPRFRNRLSQDLEQKQKILQENKELFRLYKELVTTSVISADEFWQTYASEKLNHKSTSAVQKVGVPTGFLSDVAKADGCNGIKLNLTADIMEAIFRTYPAVRKKHLELVPHEMTEKEFWTQFFQSHYFHRDRTLNNTPKALFADCLKLDEEDLQAQIRKTTNEADGGLAAYEDDRGLADQVTHVDDDDRGKQRNPAYAALLRRFNYHSSRVLQACLGDDGPSTSGVGNGQSTISLGSLLPTTSRDYGINSGDSSKKRRFVECEELVEENIDNGVALNLSHAEKYQKTRDDGLSPKRTSAGGDFGREDAVRWCRLVSGAAENWISRNADSNKIMNMGLSQNAITVLSSITCADEQAKRSKMPKTMFDETVSLYAAANELLRHFWCCFPATTPELEQKATKMYETLRRYEEAKLKPFLERSRHFQSTTGQTNPAEHISRMLQMAYDKYRQWKEQRCVYAMRFLSGAYENHKCCIHWNFGDGAKRRVRRFKANFRFHSNRTSLVGSKVVNYKSDEEHFVYVCTVRLFCFGRSEILNCHKIGYTWCTSAVKIGNGSLKWKAFLINLSWYTCAFLLKVYHVVLW